MLENTLASVSVVNVHCLGPYSDPVDCNAKLLPFVLHFPTMVELADMGRSTISKF